MSRIVVLFSALALGAAIPPADGQTSARVGSATRAVEVYQSPT